MSIDSYEARTLLVVMPDRLFRETVNEFQRYGGSLEESLKTSPRLAYSIFGNCLRQICAGGEIPDLRADLTNGEISEGGTKLQAAGQTGLNKLPRLGDEPGEVVISIFKNPTLLAQLRKKTKEEDKEEVLRFSYPAEDPRLIAG